ncbi:hypothetical protein KUTeg_023144 [Tegillarca granosa]|uniref:F-box domain-containing protein n=1 Tax=Tegillarca granosa TaxID=220873 RepID=A0ABQ9E4E2_TEGGR|nr:hypothetical protein KUTeg_023144 [Tegillarca granosa]
MANTANEQNDMNKKENRKISEEEALAYSLSILHAHCENCIDKFCNIKPDGLSSCEIIDCEHGCGQRLHMCLVEEHKSWCSHVKVSCINATYGCRHEMQRRKVGLHLNACPASTIHCTMEWNRWPMHSEDECIKYPLPLHNPHVRCGQLDVALALRDQRMLVESMKAPQRTRKVLQNSITKRYPGVPFGVRSSSFDSEYPSTETSQNASEDESDTPWDCKSPPGLQRSVCSRIYGASKQTSDSLSAALDYVSHHMTSQNKHLSGIQESEESDVIDNGNMSKADEMSNMSDKSNDTGNHGDLNDESESDAIDTKIKDIYAKEVKLKELLGVSLNIECISKYQPKPFKMYTFLCAQNFRRDEYAWHTKNVHHDIQCGLNGWLQQRCPLAYQGCNFSVQKFYPNNLRSKLVHSALLESFGLVTMGSDVDEDENDELSTKFQDLTVENQNCAEDKNVSIEIGKRKLREATPEILTSQKFDSVVKVFPRFRRSSVGENTQSLSSEKECKPFHITSFPVEVLQHIMRYLDGFSLNNLSLTCKYLRDICCSLLDEKGMVLQIWEKRKINGNQSAWQVAYQKWCFSTAFTPIRKWIPRNSSAIHSHLKVCPYNRNEDCNVRTEPYQLLEMKELHTSDNNDKMV